MFEILGDELEEMNVLTTRFVEAVSLLVFSDMYSPLQA